MADTQTLATDVKAAPGDYTLPGGQTLTIGALHAHYDGTGAAGSYVPAVEIISDAGHTVLISKQDSTVAAGVSVESSHAPFLGGAAASSGGAGVTTAFRVYKSVDQTVNNATTASITFDLAAVTDGSPYTTPDNQEFDLALGTLWLVGFNLYIGGNSGGTNGEINATLQNLAVPADIVRDRKYITYPGVTTTLFTLGIPTVVDGSSGVQLRCRLQNTLGFNVTVKSGSDGSHMWGALLIP